MKKLWFWIVVGLIVRVVVSGLVIHPDIRGHNLASYYVSQKNEWLTFYDHLSKLPRSDALVQLYGDGLFIYPPLAYYSHAVFMKFTYPLISDKTFWQLIYDMGGLTKDNNLFVLLITLKLPYIVADLVGLYVLNKILDSKHRFWGSILWLVNPITIYSAYMLGQFDVYISLFIMLAILATQKKKTLWAGVFIGLAALYKPFPLFMLPMLGETFKDKVKSISIGLAVYLLGIAPFLTSTGFKTYALLASQTDKLVFAKIMVSGSQYLSLFYVGLAALYWFRFIQPKALPFIAWLSAPLLLFYSVTHFHPQWFTWAAGLLTLLAVTYKKARLPIAIFTLFYFVTVLFFEPSLNFGLFGINFNLSSWLNPKFPSDQLVSTIRSLLLATAIIIPFTTKTTEND